MTVVSTEISGLGVWDRKFEGDVIPGSSRVPVREIWDFFGGKTAGLVGLDSGSGSGRGTKLLRDQLNASVYALDLSIAGLKNTEGGLRVQGSAVDLPYKDETFDFITICGVMTNITSTDTEAARKMRHRIAAEAFRCIKPEGLVIISDFSADHTLSGYPVNYPKHELITGELGTIAVFDPAKKISFQNKSDEEIKQMASSPDLVRFAHHFQPSELAKIFLETGFEVPRYTIELGKTPSGNPIENIILSAVKPKS